MAAENPPTIEFQCPATGTPITLAFGYLDGEAMMPIWTGEGTDIVAMIPRQVLIDVLRDGWSDTESDPKQSDAHCDNACSEWVDGQTVQLDGRTVTISRSGIPDCPCPCHQ
jgi:hypothetical protein